MIVFCLGKPCLIFMMKMSLCPANHDIGLSKEHINAGIPFGSRVSIPVDGDVPNWPVSVQYFSHVEMAMLFLFDCHWLVVGALRRASLTVPTSTSLDSHLHYMSESPVHPLLCLCIIWALDTAHFWNVEHFQRIGAREDVQLIKYWEGQRTVPTTQVLRIVSGL